MNLDKFIGIPYVLGEDGYGGTDCLGLCRLFYYEHGWPQTFRDGKPIGHPSDPGQGIRLGRYFEKHFTRVEKEDLGYGDVILFNIFGDPHCGLYVGDGNCLAMQVPCIEGSRSMVYHKRFWDKAFVAGYRRR